jgi:DNA end-binding protein Ku
MAARAMWKGVVAIGTTKLPVKLYSAVQDRTVHFRLLHRKDLEPVQQKLISSGSGEPVESTATQKALPIALDRFVIVEKEELEKLEPKESREIEIEQFVEASEMDPRWYERAYWLAPDGSAESYYSLAAALENTECEGIARWVMRKKNYVGSLRAEEGCLMLITLRHADEIIAADAFQAPEGRELNKKEIEMGEQLIEALAGSFDPSDYKDNYRERVMELVELKSKGKKPKVTKFRPKKTDADDLADALAASLAGKKKVARGRR